jgi:hypothetical protein
MRAPSNFSGGCACGAVRYECSSAPAAMVNCHCRDCQRASGAGYAPTLIVSPTHFRVTRGQPKYHEVMAQSGSTARRAFCEGCGSPLFASTSARPDFVGIRAGSLDDPSWFRATVDAWTASAQPWDALSEHTTKYPGNPSRRRDAG